MSLFRDNNDLHGDMLNGVDAIILNIMSVLDTFLLSGESIKGSSIVDI